MKFDLTGSIALVTGKRVIAGMKAKGSGRIINIFSVAADHGGMRMR
jgi:NAD(P)-dependent dehydrogenase (short-subunit alcohol dehydrogenase family)